MSINIEKTKLVVLDFDGVLADSGEDIAASIRATQRHFGVREWNTKDILSFVGHGAKHIVFNTLAEAGEDKLPEALAFYMAYYQEHTTDFTTLYPGVRDFLLLLKDRNIPACVLTNKPEVQARKILGELGVEKLFTLVVGPESVSKMKPDPEGLKKCMEHAKVAPEETVMVGDAYSDVQTGHNGGTMTCGVLYGIGDREKLKAEKPDVLVENRLAEMFGL